MNYGSKVRITAARGPTGRPVIYWGRGMDNRRGNPSKPTRNASRAVGRGKAETAGAQKPVARNPRSQKRGGGSGSDISPGTVTLTQTQLDAILSTVGSLMSENQKLHSKNLEAGGDDIDTTPEISENIFNLGTKLPEERKRSGRSQRGPAYVEPGEVPGLGFIDRNDAPTYTEKTSKSVSPSVVPGLGAVDAPSRPTDLSKAHMTKAELKRLQWDRERDTVDDKSPLGDLQDSPLFGIGSRKPQPVRHHRLAPLIPKAHLTKAERLRQVLAETEEEALANPVSPGRTLTDYWSNQKEKSPSTVNVPPKSPPPPNFIPTAHLTKAEKKRKQWENERAENAERDAILHQPPPPRSRQPLDMPRTPPGKGPPGGGEGGGGGVPRGHLSKAEVKRLQWEKERAEMEKLKSQEVSYDQPNYGRKMGNFSAGKDQVSTFVPTQGMSKTEIKRLQWERERAENAEMEKWQEMTDKRGQYQHVSEQRSPEQNPTFVQNTGPSKAEMKRRQWEQERAENEARDMMQVGAQGGNYNKPPVLSPDEDTRAGYVPSAGPTRADLKRQQWEREKAENEGFGGWQIGGNQQPTHGRRAQPTPPGGDGGYHNSPVTGVAGQKPVSKSDMKRLQWQRERNEIEQAEHQGEYNPWGRPGAGAPIRDPSGNVLSDYNQRKENEDVRNSYQEPGPTPRTEQPALIDKYRHGLATTNNFQPPGVVLSEVEANRPAAIRSSFAFGNSAPDDQRFISQKEKEKRQWLEDLERQREDKRLEKLREKEKRKEDEGIEMWADRYAPPTSRAAPPPPDMRVSSAPNVEPTTIPGLDLQPPLPQYQQNGVLSPKDSEPGNFIRGQNPHIDATSRREYDERRQRQIEHQDAIKAQVEENKRKKMEEREQRAQEELEEERKLQAERDNLQAMYDGEKRKAQEKEDQQKRRVQSLKQAMDAAAEDAQREKHARRLAKLQQGGHDTSHLNAKFEGYDKRPSLVEPEHFKSNQAMMTPRVGAIQHVQPTSIPGLDLTPRDLAVNPAIYTPHEPYTSDRVIVPTKYKESPSLPYTDPVSPRREFGVQTDPTLAGGPFGNTQTLSRESTDIEYKGPFKTDKKVRIKSSDSMKDKKPPQKVNERPKWGVRNQNKTVDKKKAVKQSEKDPYYEKRKKAREAQKIQRQQEMMEMAEKSLARARNLSNMRTRSKSRERNHGDAQTVDQRTRTLERRSRTGPSPTVLKARSNQVSPARDQSRDRRKSSPDPVPSHRSKIDPPRGHQRQSRRDTQENEPPVMNGYHTGSVPNGTSHTTSPPVPSIKSRIDVDYDLDSHAYKHTKPSNLKQDSSRSHYNDINPFGGPVNEGDFVPFVRSATILNPEKAEVPLPMSRETTAVENARKAYIHGIQPASYGTRMPNYEDKHIREAAIPEMPSMPEPEWSRDPIMNPGLLKDHPTGRQDRILQQLSDLRRGLMQKQRELEIASPLIDA